MPRLQQLLQEALPASHIRASIPPEEVVAVGTALEAGLLAETEWAGPDDEVSCGSVPCVAMELWLAVSVRAWWENPVVTPAPPPPSHQFPDSEDAVATQLVLPHTPLPLQRSVTTIVKVRSVLAHGLGWWVELGSSAWGLD